MLVRLISTLRLRGVPVGTQELVALAAALDKGLHNNSIDEFYRIARSLLIHNEAHLDEYDQVFMHLYKGATLSSKQMLEDIDDWLKSPATRPELTDEERTALKALDIDELKKLFEERLKEQKERHDGGNYWIGTGGRSPFGTGGYHPTGISLKRDDSAPSAGGRSALRSANARLYRGYRQDLVLDTRQLEVALRKLRSFDRNNQQQELDLEGTVDATAKAFGELELVFKKPRKPNTRVILMLDVGGSMDPYMAAVSQLFTAAKRATHWKELRTYYFHNCIYGKVFTADNLREPVLISDLIRECNERYKLIIVGDASMASYELLGWDEDVESKSMNGLQWLFKLRTHFPASVWLNPDFSGGRKYGHSRYETTVDVIAQVFKMLPLSLSGLGEALSDLQKSKVAF